MPLNIISAAEKTYHFKELHIETIIRHPKRVGLFGYRNLHLHVLGYPGSFR